MFSVNFDSLVGVAITAMVTGAASGLGNYILLKGIISRLEARREKNGVSIKQDSDK